MLSPYSEGGRIACVPLGDNACFHGLEVVVCLMRQTELLLEDFGNVDRGSSRRQTSAVVDRKVRCYFGQDVLITVKLIIGVERAVVIERVTFYFGSGQRSGFDFADVILIPCLCVGCWPVHGTSSS